MNVDGMMQDFQQLDLSEDPNEPMWSLVGKYAEYLWSQLYVYVHQQPSLYSISWYVYGCHHAV